MGNNALVERGLSWMFPMGPENVATRARWRIFLHLIPFLFFLYILAYLDRVNVSVAQLTMVKAPAEGGIGFDKAIIGFGAGLFFWGYMILEVPSTISAERWGARWVFGLILILWGLCAALAGTIGTPFCARLFAWLPPLAENGPGWAASAAHFINGLHGTPDTARYQFYFFRFMLGFFEGGFFPTVIVYLSQWFRAEDRAKAIAFFMAAIPIASILGSPLSGLIAEVQWLDLPGWRWVFLLEGIAPVLAGFVTLLVLPDRPAQARWLPPEEYSWLAEQLEEEHQAKKVKGWRIWVRHLGMVLLLTVVYFCLNVPSYGLVMFMPAIIQSQVIAYAKISNQRASFLAALPYIMALFGLLLNGWHSDRTRERPWHVAVPLALLSASLVLAAKLDGIWIWSALVMIICVGGCMYAHLAAFWPIPSMYLGATAAAAAIGFINMFGNLGGFFGPDWVGDAANQQGNFTGALLRMAPFPFAAAVIILGLAFIRRQPAIEPAGAPPAEPVESRPEN